MRESENKEKRLFVSKVWCKLASRLNLLHKRGLFAKHEREKQKQNFILFKNISKYRKVLRMMKVAEEYSKN